MYKIIYIYTHSRACSYITLMYLIQARTQNKISGGGVTKYSNINCTATK